MTHKMYNITYIQYNALDEHYNTQAEKNMANLSPFLLYVFVTTFTPGPNNILAMANGLQYGYRKTLGFLAGMFAGFCLVMWVCGLLNVALLSWLPQAKMGLNVLGAAYMLYLAVHIAFSKPPQEHQPEKQGLNSFRAGFAMQFLNLKVILYGITVFSLFIIQFSQNPVIVSLFAPFLAAVGFLATSCWALGGNLFRNLVHQNSRLFNLAMAALLIYTALAGLVESLGLLPH